MVFCEEWPLAGFAIILLLIYKTYSSLPVQDAAHIFPFCVFWISNSAETKKKILKPKEEEHKGTIYEKPLYNTIAPDKYV